MKKILVAAALAASMWSGAAQSAVEIVNVPIGQIPTFDSRVTTLGGTVIQTAVVDGVGVYNYTDANGNPATLTVTRLDGNPLGWTTTYDNLTAPAWDISPSTEPSDTIPGEKTGLRFTFSSPVNAFGLEIGDWATCCYSGTRPAAIQSTYGVPAEGSGLWIRFNGGAATLPANALSENDNPGWIAESRFTNFIGAIDDSGSFTTVDFWGDGFGEALYAGGTLRFAAIRRGAIGGTVAPVPAVSDTGLLAGLLGIAAFGAYRMRRRAIR